MQGMKRVSSKPRMSWQEILFKRLEGEFDKIPTGVSTGRAEDGLELGRCTCFCVGRCDPGYSNVAVRYIAAGDYRVAPFDTGGLWDDKYPVDLSPGCDKRSLVESTSFDGLQYVSPFQCWVAAVYDHDRGYVDGVPPGRHYLPEILYHDADPRSWTWEVRLRRDADSSSLPTIVAVCLSSQDRDLYVRWVRNLSSESFSRRRRHLKMFFERCVDCGHLVAGAVANQDIVKDVL